MRVKLCVDDEELLLTALVRAVEESPDIQEAVGFRLCSEALAWAEQNRPDVAFLDIQMRGMTGLELAQKLHALHPGLPIVFCTGYREYAFDAIQLRASGYLVKPVRPEQVQHELDVIKGRDHTAKLLTVQCFGTFEVFADGKPLVFKRKRAKELFAFLIDRRGASVTTRDICIALWEDDLADDKNIQHLYKLFADLREALTAVGAQDALIRGKQDYAVDTEQIDCDYYRYLAGDPVAAKSFCGEYMTQYSWAEETAAALQLG